MLKIVSFSGGRTSAYLCKVMIDKFGLDNVRFIYMDTGAEHLKTYKFIKKVNNFFGLNLICLRGDFNQPLGKGVNYKIVDINTLKPDLIPFSQMLKKYGVPYIGGMFCTDRMKLTPFKKYCDHNFGKNNYQTWLGIRIDEGKRLRIKKDIKYLADISDFEKQDVLNWWRSQPFDLDIDEWLGNCIFCPKKSNLKLAMAQREAPDLYNDFLKMLYSISVRNDTNTGHYSKMYRGNQSLKSLIMTFNGSTDQEIKARIKGGKMAATNSCSENCDIYS